MNAIEQLSRESSRGKVIQFKGSKDGNNEMEKIERFDFVFKFDKSALKDKEYNRIKGSEVNMDNEKYLDRLSQEFKEREERIDKNNVLMENRITEERRLSEERMENRFNTVMNQLSKTDHKIECLGDKIDSTNKWITGLCISTIIGIAAIVITSIVTLMK